MVCLGFFNSVCRQKLIFFACRFVFLIQIIRRYLLSCSFKKTAWEHENFQLWKKNSPGYRRPHDLVLGKQYRRAKKDILKLTGYQASPRDKLETEGTNAIHCSRLRVTKISKFPANANECLICSQTTLFCSEHCQCFWWLVTIVSYNFSFFLVFFIVCRGHHNSAKRCVLLFIQNGIRSVDLTILII